MEPFVKHTGIVALLNQKNIDTDQIIPKQFLKKIEKTGFGQHLFHDWRFLADGSDNSEFELNDPAYKDASILVAGDNFGCGSSREHAPWALLDYGFRAIISTSFADIFFSNCFKNGILPIKVSEAIHAKLAEEIKSNIGVQFTIDLQEQIISTPCGLSIEFEIDKFRRENLLKGLDQIAWSLKHLEQIKAFEDSQRKIQSWLWING